MFVNFIFKFLLIAFLNFSPSEFLTNTDGILTFESVAIFINDSSPSPLYIITPSAPAACAFKFLSIKVISPLFIKATFPFKSFLLKSCIFPSPQSTKSNSLSKLRLFSSPDTINGILTTSPFSSKFIVGNSILLLW